MMTIAEKIKIMQAFEDGAEIESGNRHTFGVPVYAPIQKPQWNWEKCDYRIKPKAKRKLYLWAYLSGFTWGMTSTFYEDETAARKIITHATQFKRLDYTMVEVD